MVPVQMNIIFCLSQVLILCVKIIFSTDCVSQNTLANFAIREAKCMELAGVPSKSLVAESEFDDHSDNKQKAFECQVKLEEDKINSLCYDCPMCTLNFNGSEDTHNIKNYQVLDEFSFYISEPELYCRSDTNLKVLWNAIFDNITVVYLVERTTDESGMNWVPVTIGKKTIVEIKNLTRNTTYKVRIHAFTANGQLGGSVTSDWLRTLSGCDEVKAAVNATTSVGKTYDDHAVVMITWQPGDDLSCVYEIAILDSHGNSPAIAHNKKISKAVTAFANVSYDVDYTCFITTIVNESCDKFTASKNIHLSCLETVGYNYTLCVPPPPQLSSIFNWVTNKPKNGSYVIDIEVEWEWKSPERPDIFLVKANMNLGENNSYSKVLNVSGEENYAKFTALNVDVTGFTCSVRACGKVGCSDPAINLSEVNTSGIYKTKWSWHTLVSIVVPLIVVLLVIAIGLWIYCTKMAMEEGKDEYIQPMNFPLKRKEDLENSMLLIESPEGVPDAWKINYNDLILEEKLGEGAFGVVHKGLHQNKNGHWYHVAIKKLQDKHEPSDFAVFQQEISVMKLVGQHPNIVSIIGYCNDIKNLCLVVEYCPLGDLHKYLRKEVVLSTYENEITYEEIEKNKNGMKYEILETAKGTRELTDVEGLKVLSVDNKLYMEAADEAMAPTRKRKNNLTPFHLLSYARQITIGMEYLSKNHVVHRDLAARNILVVSHAKVKISDFGLSRDIYEKNYYHKKGKGRLPVKWMAIESLIHQMYTSYSDVWSYGILLWEIVTMGGTPYPGLEARQLYKYLKTGYRMERPKNCSEELYKIMLSCWAEKPKDRPTFSDLHKQLDKLMESSTSLKYLELLTTDY